jgi:hypothetical protein
VNTLNTVHNAGDRVASLMYYDGVYNKIYIGRNKGWGVTQTEISGNFTMPCDRWIYSGDALRTRLHYETNGTSYYQGYGGDYAAAHQWRNRDGNWVMSLNNLGDCGITGQFNCQLYTISGSYRDFVGVYLEDSQVNDVGNYVLKVIQGTFTGFHGVFTEDELFNKDEPQLFKDNYIGRIVVSNGKIATDTNDNEKDWVIKYDKEGITI